jgi:ABC-type spermidine/putrescine transport systems, ATPase components
MTVREPNTTRERAMSPALVEVRDLVVVRGAHPVLTIDHLAIADRETLALVGPNGAGKSTLLLALASLVRLARGQVWFRGSPVGSGDELAYRRHIGLVLPDPLLLNTSVFANVAAGLRFRGVSSADSGARVMDWLGRLGVGHLSRRPAREISSGEAQRVSLARALVLEPDLLLLDEPFASVDAATRATLLDDFERLLRETHVACVIVTHDLDEAVRLGDRMAVVVEGQLRQCDAPERVLSAPLDGDVAAFVGAETRLPGRVVSTHEGIALVDVGQCQIEAVSAVQPGRSVLCCLRPEDVTLWSIDGRGSGTGEVRRRLSGSPGDSAAEAPARFVSSARNQLPGRVSRTVSQGSLMRVSIDCGIPLVASITRASAADMELEEGASVVATFKASAVHLIPLTG